MTAAPQFLVVGGQRCGTTSLFYLLGQHQRITLPDQKEIHYFNRHYSRGWRWYQSFFPEHKEGEITGEASPNYLLSWHAPPRVKRDLPSVRLIFLLRNPIDRAYSHFNAKRRLGIEGLTSFEAAIAAEPERIASDLNLEITDENFYSANVRHFSYLSRGLYAQQIHQWLQFFPREQCYFVLSEELFRNPARVCDNIAEFLNLPGFELLDMSPRGVGEHLWGPYPPLSEETRRLLEEFYTPEVTQVRLLTNLEVNWF